MGKARRLARGQTRNCLALISVAWPRSLKQLFRKRSLGGLRKAAKWFPSATANADQAARDVGCGRSERSSASAENSLRRRAASYRFASSRAICACKRAISRIMLSPNSSTSRTASRCCEFQAVSCIIIRATWSFKWSSTRRTRGASRGRNPFQHIFNNRFTARLMGRIEIGCSELPRCLSWRCLR